ncbi:hypothetical protein QR680_014229 [Steinernema hermaphroditum]|uniref:Translation initiation factor eIF2B subunit gamma n=1 Tax=Steinernema hermaphroditum TaxID=289476 RepID=A0AA39I868_9BILA|nr:hypothetical protein QR680_014229 [Steinernema hermaphroditum]
MLSRFVANAAVRRLGSRAFCSAGDDGPKKPKEPSAKDILGEKMLSAVDSVATTQNPQNPAGRKRMRDMLKAKLIEAEKQTFDEATASQTAEMLSQQSVVDLLKSVPVQSTPRVALPSRIRVGKKETIALRREIVYQAIQKGYKASEAQRIAEDAVARAEERMIKRAVETHEQLKEEDATKAAREEKIAKEEQEFYDAANNFFEKLMYDPEITDKPRTATRVEVKESAPNVFVDDVRALGIFPENGEGLKESRLAFWQKWDAEWVQIYNQSMGPNNGIEEQIEWTKKGKLWPYPINNEYMLGEEERIGFQDHIFLERFVAQSNLPKSGPIAHFMELVSVGLSKNPHMTAKKKLEHIRWFINYFNEQKAIVLAGGIGNRMREITDAIPKCLLPVAGVPVFWYPLNLLSRHRIIDVILVTSTKTVAEVKSLLHHDKLPKFANSLNIDIVGTDLDDTGHVLLSLKDKIKNDFIVISGDFVSDLSLQPLLNVYRASDAWFTCLLAENAVNGPTPGPKVKRSKYRDLVITTPTDTPFTHDSQLLHMIAEEEVDDAVAIPNELFEKFRNVSASGKYNDCHVYVFKHAVLKLIEEEDEEEMASIKNEIVPFLLSRQYYPMEEENIPKEPSWSIHARMLSSGNATVDKKYYIKCMAYMVTPENGTMVAHLNQLGSYLETNKAIIHSLETISPALSHGQKLDKVTESFVCQGTAIGADKVVLKKSMIGAKCTIGDGAKITGSLIMDNVTIGEGAQLTNCIVCHNVQIGTNALLNNCIVAKDQTIEDNAQHTHDLIKPEDEMQMD